MLNFNFSEKALVLVSTPHFVFDFSRRMFLLHSTDQILLSACFYFSRYAVRLKKIVMEFDFLTIFINIATATISQVHSLSSSFNIVFFVWHFAVNKLVIVRKRVPVSPF